MGRREEEIDVGMRFGRQWRWAAVALAAQLALGAVTAPVAMAGPQGASGGGTASGPPTGTGPTREVVASLPVGGGPGEIGVEVGPEETWGASAFAVGPDGVFYVVDGVNDKIVVLSADGAMLREIPLPEPLVGPEDIAVTADGVYVLDVAAQPGVVCRLDAAGCVQRTWEVPPEHSARHGVTGIAVQDAEGEDIFLELDGSWQVPFVEDGGAVTARSLPLVRHGNRADVPAADAARFGIRSYRPGRTYSTCLDTEAPNSGTITCNERGGRRIRLVVRAKGEIGRLVPIGEDRDSRHYAAVDELAEDGKLSGSRISAFGADGVEQGAFRVPTERFATWPNKPVRVSQDGHVFCLVPSEGAVTIERLPEEKADSSVAAMSEEPQSEEPRREDPKSRGSWLARFWDKLLDAVEPSEAHAAWTRLNASDRAWEFVDLAWYCSKANYDRSCGDYRPAYLTAYGKTYYGVPYCWGGFDTAATFKSLMSSGKDAGDVNTSGSKRSCTGGVDCSGFVSRVWGLGTKYSTKTLPNISYRIARTSMAVGDIYNIAGSHAIVFRYLTSTGASAVWESTMSSDKDRVVAWTRTSAQLANYDTRRYQNW